MRRMNLRSMASFITREHTLDINNIRSLLFAEHEKYLQLHPARNAKATQRIVIASYLTTKGLKFELGYST